MPDIDVGRLRSDPRVVWTEDVIRFSDTDLNGHVNNSAFAVFCESGRVNLLRGTLAPSREPGTYFVVARLTIEFRAEMHYPGRVASGTWIRSLGRTSLVFGQVLLDDRGGLVAVSDAVTVSMSEATRRPAEFGPATRDLVRDMLLDQDATAR